MKDYKRTIILMGVKYTFYKQITYVIENHIDCIGNISVCKL